MTRGNSHPTQLLVNVPFSCSYGCQDNDQKDKQLQNEIIIKEKRMETSKVNFCIRRR